MGVHLQSICKTNNNNECSMVETTEKEDSPSVKTRPRRRAKALTRREMMMLAGDKDEEKRDTRVVFSFSYVCHTILIE